jgi:hypothetical protein
MHHWINRTIKITITELVFSLKFFFAAFQTPVLNHTGSFPVILSIVFLLLEEGNMKLGASW